MSRSDRHGFAQSDVRADRWLVPRGYAAYLADRLGEPRQQRDAAIGWASRGSNETRQESIEGHVTIAQAIANGDPTKGEQAMVEHFDLTVKALLAAGVY
ncbi:FCD domain-containing protein [Sinorhizobium medicae]|uniref:FCD domain-containing protein n=1 Tax=Sinorhizobium medicae TaxID=110321 RepID=UPI0027DCB691|nr:FCD domain-containing protein [Sinorhizobium medicae]